MHDLEVIYYIRDEMLSDPEIDAGFAWAVHHKAQYDADMYTMMNNWMKETSKSQRQYIEYQMEMLLEDPMTFYRRKLSHKFHPSIRDN